METIAAGDAAAEARGRLRRRVRRLLAGDESLFDRHGRPRTGPWLEACAGVPPWRVLTLLPQVLAELAADAEQAPRLEAAGLPDARDALARGVAAAKVASLVAALERERRGSAGDLVAGLRDEVMALRDENARLRRAVESLMELCFAEAEARAGAGAVPALPPPDPAAVMNLILDAGAAEDRDAAIPAEGRRA